MKKEREFPEKDGIAHLNQLIKTLEEAEGKLEDAYEKKDHEEFNKIRKFILNLTAKISEMTDD